VRRSDENQNDSKRILENFSGTRAAGFPERSERGRDDKNRRKESPAETLLFAAAIFSARDLSGGFDSIRLEPASQNSDRAKFPAQLERISRPDP
jgi:hypothetical protein